MLSQRALEMVAARLGQSELQVIHFQTQLEELDGLNADLKKDNEALRAENSQLKSDLSMQLSEGSSGELNATDKNTVS